MAASDNEVTAPRWVRRPEGSNWGDFGADDQLGCLNYITAAEIRSAVAEVREGRTFCLSLPLDYPGGRVLAPHRFPPVLHATERRGEPFFNYAFKRESENYRDMGCDDYVTLCTQYSTQWDAFAHVGHAFDADGDGEAEYCYYNGYRAGSDIRSPAERGEQVAMPLTIDKFAERAIQGRGVLLDLEHHFGREKRTLGLAEIRTALEADRVTLRRGDILCLHTGFADELLKLERSPTAEQLHNSCSALDGSDQALLDWLSEVEIAALVADNYAVERIAHGGGCDHSCYVPLHHHCLFKRGIPLGELWYLTDLAKWLRAAGRHSFLLTAPPLRLPGAVGSPVTPVATV